MYIKGGFQPSSPTAGRCKVEMPGSTRTNGIDGSGGDSCRQVVPNRFCLCGCYVHMGPINQLVMTASHIQVWGNFAVDP